jgi:folate-dependent phosphoribosylglycinamide formyltransferase PurN
MSVQPAIALFAYAFPHRKTRDFILELASSGFTRVSVIAAPWRKLVVADSGVHLPNSIQHAPPHGTSEACKLCNFSYHEIPHDDVEAIAALQREHGFDLGIVAGARILKPAILRMFNKGIVNFHPGKLPEAAGLDAFFKTITQRSSPGVTAHYIDHRVDAGRELFFEETQLGPDDMPEVVRHNIYQSELRALRRFVKAFASGAEMPTKEIDRPEKSSPMDAAGKLAALEGFASWRSQTYVRQKGKALLEACKIGDVPHVVRILADVPGLLEFRGPESWTPLIVAAFNQQSGVVRELIERGANVNATNHKGTTVLMYAKTAILNQPEADYALLRTLIKAGAEIGWRDRLGRSVVEYVDDAGDARLKNWLSSGEHSQ